jgi:hypothetical protein
MSGETNLEREKRLEKVGQAASSKMEWRRQSIQVESNDKQSKINTNEILTSEM